jgi:tetrahydromethanopterin S-methyltransferase subunit G
MMSEEENVPRQLTGKDESQKVNDNHSNKSALLLDDLNE